MSDFLVCSSGQVTGVVDCIPDVEKSGSLCRQEHLGFDRHGRKYWFLARRIFVYVHFCVSVKVYLPY
jgi:nucleosome-remodeling factor subunit BPTF